MNYLILFILFAVNAHTAEPIVVKLETEDRLLPLYLGRLKNESTSFTTEYISQLEMILAFDLNHASRTKTSQNSPDLEAICAIEEIAKGEHLPTWKALNIFYVVKPYITENQKLSAKIVHIHKKNVKTFEGIPLSGDLKIDRKQVHKLADAIHKALFDRDGIAASQIIYTLKKRLTKEREIAEVWISDYDGGNPRQITHENALCVTPTFFPPKSGHRSGSIFFTSYISGVPKIHSMNLEDEKSQRVFSLRGNQLMPAISLQRDQIAFVSDASGNTDLFISPMDPDTGEVGKPRQIFTAVHATQGTPTFSPDGKKVAFVSNKDGRARIYSMTIPDLDTPIHSIKPALISKRNRASTSPQWSPDGNWIAYQALIEGTQQICIYELKTGVEKVLTDGEGNKENPSWAPDSQHLVYNSGGEIYLIDILHPKPIAITKGPGEKRFPAWEPRARKIK